MTENKTMTEKEMLQAIQEIVEKLDDAQNTIEKKKQLYDDLFSIAIEMYQKHKNKTGFLNIFFRYNKSIHQWQEKKKVLMKKEVLMYASEIGIDLFYSISRHQLDVNIEKLKQNPISFSDFVKNIRDEEKEKRNEEKTRLSQVKTIDISKIKSLDEVKSLLLKLQEKKKDLMKNQD